MKTIALITALLCSGLAVPAFAQSQAIGSIDVGNDNGMGGPGMRGPGGDMRGPGNRDMRGPGMMGPNRMNDREVRTFTMGGPVESLSFRAERDDVRCRSVDATFGNGQRRNIFNGTIREGRTVNVDMPGRQQSIRALDFNCSSERNRGATIRIMADVGRYRGEWRRGPNWQRDWARVFNWGSNAMNDWQMIGSSRFDGRRDQETSFPGRRGLRVDAIALKPLETDARCDRVQARFGNRGTQNLAVNRGDVLRRGQFYKLDLPGDTRDLTAISMTCSATSGPYVTMQIFTSH